MNPDVYLPNRIVNPWFFSFSSAIDAVDLYRLLEPVKDARIMPPIPLERLSKLSSADKFIVDVDVGKISLSLSGGPVEIGDRMFYADIKYPLNWANLLI